MSTNTFDVITECLAECDDADPDYAPDEEHDRADCILEALDRAGMEIVELPAPDGNGNYAVRRDGKKTITTVKADSAYYGEPMVALDTSSVRTFYRADRAREVGAALIAAANAAEAMS